MTTETALNHTENSDYVLHRRFDRMGRLVGDDAMAKLFDSHVMIVGLGGVGSWAAEAIARAGVGKITLVDFDEICVTNANRQLHALKNNIGRSKAEVMGERLQQINPQADVRIQHEFFSAHTVEKLFAERPDFVIDAIDSITSKCFLLDYCRRQSIPVVSSTGSGGRLDPSQIRVADLAFSRVDPLAHEVRRILREKYNFPNGKKDAFGVLAVFSVEPHRKPKELHYDKGQGFRCVCPQGQNPFFNCDNRNLIWGNAGFVTGSYGLMAASVVVRSILGEADQIGID